MTKIRVKLRPSSVDGKRGTIYYCISHKSVVRHITTKIHILPEEWNGETQQIVFAESRFVQLQNRIDRDLATLERIVSELELRRVDFSADDIVKCFRAPERRISVTAFFREQIAFLIDCNRLGTAVNYRQAAETLDGFLGGYDLSFSELTSQLVEQYGDYLLRKGMVRNSLSFHMRILRAVYNKAVRRGYVEQTFPFRDIYTGVDRTRKRAVGEEIIHKLMNLELEEDSVLSFTRDMFMFSFFTRGMAFVDMAYLRKSDIQDGILRYARRKTGQQLAVRIEPCIGDIIDRYATLDSPYVFPILGSEDFAVGFRRYKSALRAYNHRLKRLSQMIGLECGISSYTARHSWATAARNHNVPLSVISAGMGHSSERTTQIYLTSLENSLIDMANKDILDSLRAPFLVKRRILR